MEIDAKKERKTKNHAKAKSGDNAQHPYPSLCLEITPLVIFEKFKFTLNANRHLQQQQSASSTTATDSNNHHYLPS